MYERDDVSKLERQLEWQRRVIRNYEWTLERLADMDLGLKKKPKNEDPLDPFVWLEKGILKGLDALEWLFTRGVDVVERMLYQLVFKRKR